MHAESYQPAYLEYLIDLIQRLRPAEWRSDYPSAPDLHEILAQSGPAERTRLWLAEDGQLAAFALVDAYNNLLFELDANYDLEQAVVDWGVACLGEMRRQGLAEADTSLDASCRQEDTRRLELLLRQGFAIQPGGSLHYRRGLAADIPPAQLPPGYRLTHAAALTGTPGLLERIVELHRAAFGTQHMTVKERQSIMSSPAYDPSLDLFITAPDGSLAGYCTVTLEPDTPGVGFTDPIAVHPAQQGSGLGRALLLEGLRRLRQLGLHEARLGTSSENLAMQALAQAAGFECYQQTIWLAKQVE